MIIAQESFPNHGQAQPHPVGFLGGRSPTHLGHAKLRQGERVVQGSEQQITEPIYV
jgi:hypothetical protein